MSSPIPSDERTSLMRRLQGWLFTGLLVLAPSALTLWVFYRLLNFVDNILGRYLRFSFVDYHRIPGLGIVATLLLLVIVGAIAARFGAGPLGRLWDRMLMRIPGVGILYGSTKSLGEALLSPGERAFQKVVLVAWPYPGVYRVGFVTGKAPADLSRRIGEEVEVVFIPHTPNPASGFVHYVPKSQVVYLDWPVEEGLKVIVSGGVVQPPGRGGMATAPPTSQPGRAIVPPAPAAPVVAAPAAPAADVPSPAAGGSSGTGA